MAKVTDNGAPPPVEEVKAAPIQLTLEQRVDALEKTVAGLYATVVPSAPQHESVRAHMTGWFKNFQHLFN